jgi:hypothetical protein
MKPSKQAAGPATFWHPDFRVVAALPDTKVIRTSFLVSFVAVAAVLATGYLLVRQEMELSSVRSQCDEWTQRTEGLRPRLDKATQSQKTFTAEETKARQIREFVTSRVAASDLLLLIAETLPRLTVLDVIEMTQEGVVRLRGSVVGSSASLAQAYADQLAAHPGIVALTESVRLRSQNRDQAGNRFTFEIELKLKGGAPAPAAKPARARKPQTDDE